MDLAELLSSDSFPECSYEVQFMAGCDCSEICGGSSEKFTITLSSQGETFGSC